MCPLMNKTITVFIADDSQMVCERLVEMLSALEGIRVIGQAGNTRDAIYSIHELDPDVVVLDIQMPGGGGIDVLKHIKEDKPSTLVVILTNYPYPQYRKKCMDEKADFFFDKSTEFHKVKGVCSELLQSPGTY